MSFLRCQPPSAAELAHYLLQTLDGGADEDAEAAWDAELARRAEEIVNGTAVGEPAKEVMRGSAGTRKRTCHAAVRQAQADGNKRGRKAGGKKARSGRDRRAISIISPPMIWKRAPAAGFAGSDYECGSADRPGRGTEAIVSLASSPRARALSLFSSPSNATLRRLLTDQGSKHWKGYAFAFAMMGMIALTTALSAWIIGQIVNEVFVGRHLAAVWEITAAIVVIYTVKGLATYGQQVVLSRVGNSIVADVQRRIFDQMLRMKVAYYSRNRIRPSSSPASRSSPSRRATCSTSLSPRFPAMR